MWSSVIPVNSTIIKRETPTRIVIITMETTILNPTIAEKKPNVFTFMTLQNYINMLGLSGNCPTYNNMYKTCYLLLHDPCFLQLIHCLKKVTLDSCIAKKS